MCARRGWHYCIAQWLLRFHFVICASSNSVPLAGECLPRLDVPSLLETSGSLGDFHPGLLVWIPSSCAGCSKKVWAVLCTQGPLLRSLLYCSIKKGMTEPRTQAGESKAVTPPDTSLAWGFGTEWAKQAHSVSDPFFSYPLHSSVWLVFQRTIKRFEGIVWR